ncbi:MAG TPA: sialidase family protein [Actinomycetota bacterium]|nr:sialidase family protein [Actinomycetota bacterium]
MTVPLVIAIVVATFLPRPAVGEMQRLSEGPGHGHPGGLLDLAHLPTSVLKAPWPQGPGKVVSHTAEGSAGRRSSAEVDVFTTGHMAAEPTIGVDEDGTIFTVAIDTGSGLPRWPVLKSSDGGQTWTDVSPKLPTGEFTHFTSQDGMLYLDDATGRVFMSDFTGPCAPVSFTDDDGETWTTGAACGLADHQNVFAGPPAVSPTVGYPNVVYYCAVDGGALQEASTMTGCVKSLDGGRTYVRTGSPPYVDGLNPAPGNFGIPGRCSGVTGHGVVDQAGTVYMPRGWCGQPWLAISSDEGATWRRVQVADNGMPSQSGGPTDYNPNDATGFQEHEAGVAVDEDGTIYYFYTGMNRLPYLVYSSDEGSTWSDPLMIGAPGLREASLPAIDIDGSGRLALAYIGSMNAPGGEAPDGAGPEYAGVTWNGYITVVDTPVTARSKFHTATVNDPGDPLTVGECWILRCQQQYDFIDVVLDASGRAWASMVDGCTGMSCARMGQGIVAKLTLPR